MGATAHTGEGWGSIATDSGYNRHYNFAFSLLFNTIGNGGPLQRGADSPTGLNCAELGRPFTWNDAMHITCLVYSVLLKSHGHPDGLHCGDSLTSSPEQADNIAEPGSDDRAEVFVTARAKDAGTHRSGCQWQDLAPICAICASNQCQSCLPCVNSSESSFASKPDTEYCLATCARIYACATAMLAQAKPKQSAWTAFVRIRELVGQATTVHSAVLDQICGYLAFLSAHNTVAQASRQTYPMPMAGNDSKMTHQIYLESGSGLDNYYEILSTSIL